MGWGVKMLIGNQSHTAEADKDLWATPWDIFHGAFHGAEALFRVKFDLDACASEHNAKCKRFITAEENMLTCDWGQTGQNVWINPPYSDPTPFIQRAIEQSRKHQHFVVMLLPADTSVKWFNLCVNYASQIWFITASENEGGRINFLHNATGKATAGNSKGSMLVVFDYFHFLTLETEKFQPNTYYLSREWLKQLGKEQQND